MGYVIVDIDGTISKIGDRLNCILTKPKNFEEFYSRCGEDTPIRENIELVYSLYANGNIIIFCTGRVESVREQTHNWIMQNFPNNFDYHKLLMRHTGDYRSDTITKLELVKDAGILPQDIKMVLEDRSKMVKAWRDLGVLCLQVADGDY